MPHASADDWLMALGIAVGAIGIAILLITRTRPRWLEGISLAGVGPVSLVAWALTGLAIIAIGYHVFVHAASLPQFRAPMPLVAIVSVVVIAGSLAIDALDNRHDQSGEDRSDGDT